jgi:hypothetical protein
MSEATVIAPDVQPFSYTSRSPEPTRCTTYETELRRSPAFVVLRLSVLSVRLDQDFFLFPIGSCQAFFTRHKVG